MCFGLAIAALLVVGPSNGPAAAQGTQDIAGTWQGTMNVGQAMRIVVKIARASSGWKGELYSIDSGAEGIVVPSITLQGAEVRFTIASIEGGYAGKLSEVGDSGAG